MKRKFSLLAGVAAAMALLFALSGCSVLDSITSDESYTPEKKDPTVTSPTIGQDGVLRVGVNSSNAPFSAQVSGNIQGIDIDIAAAIADQMGLELQVVDVGTDPEGALDQGTVDIIMSVDTTDSTTTCWTSSPYLQSSVALFSMDENAGLPFADDSSDEASDSSADSGSGSAEGDSSDEATDSQDSSAIKIAAQESSMSAWEVSNQYGEDVLQSSDDLKSAFDALSSGEVPYVAADAIIGSYVAHSSGIDAHIVGIMEAPSGYCVGASTENADLQNAVTEALTAIGGNGVIPVIEQKWLGSAIDVSSYAMTDDAAASAASGDGSEGSDDSEGSGESITTEGGGEVGSNAVDITDDSSGN